MTFRGRLDLTNWVLTLGLLASPGIAWAGGPSWVSLNFDGLAAPIDNPLKGFMNYEALAGLGTLPHSLEYFYVPLDAVMTGPTTFDWSFIDTRLSAIAARGRQAVFRVYVDFPLAAEDASDCLDADEDRLATSAVPDHLIDPGVCGSDCVPLTHYCSQDETLEGFTPDYDWDGADSDTRPDLLEAFESFITALATRYDGDVRVAFLQLGLIGHWGEWHTYFDEPSIASNETLNAVLVAYDSAFQSTHTVVSADVLQYDQFEVQWGVRSIGLHDDAFADTTLQAPFGMLARLQDLGFDEDWQFLPIGGEVAPHLQSTIHDSCPPMNDLDEAIDAVHASWLLDAYLFEGDGVNPPTPSELACATASARRMGYVLWVQQALLGDFARDGVFDLAVRMRNAGVAPFYAEWPVELAVRRVGDGAVVRSWIVQDWYLPDVLPDPTGLKDFLFTEPDHFLEAEQYTVSLRVSNPMAGGRPLLFANVEQGPEWLDLGVVEVTFEGVFADGFEFGDTSRWSATAP